MPSNKELLKEVNILYVEDEEEIREFASKTLVTLVKNLVVAVNGQEGLDIFTKYYESEELDQFDLVITDINMPKMSGLDMIEAIHKIDSDIPSVVTTAHGDSDFLKHAIELGVRGYVMKPMNLFKLIDGIIVASESRMLRKKLQLTNQNLEIQVHQRTAELEATVKELEINSIKLLYEATHDHLTSLYNRQKLTEELKREILREHRYKRSLAIVMFDIDLFKNINDTYGHDIGDDVLVAISNIATKHVRNVDTLARWGGEEFILLLPETSLEDACNVAEKLRLDIQNTALAQVEASKITASFGVSVFKEDDTQDTFLKRVDEALYKAKDDGRNKVVIK